VESESAVFSGGCVDCCLGGSLKLENFGITGGAVEDIAEDQVKLWKRLVEVLVLHSVAVLAFLRHRRLVTIEL
jgi:hypothetical protein